MHQREEKREGGGGRRDRKRKKNTGKGLKTGEGEREIYDNGT